MSRRLYLTVAALAILAAQAIGSKVLGREPFLPSPPPLSVFPAHLTGWDRKSDETVDPAALDKLGPDDFMARRYQEPGGARDAELFVAYYKTQLRSKNAHDPKVCLPGAGWEPVVSHSGRVTLPNSHDSFPVNYYRIRKGDSEQVVVYWFQTHSGIYTLEQQLKAHRVWDAILDNRTDMALVRIVVPVAKEGVSAADAAAMRLASAVYTNMIPYFPPTQKARS
jgi:EpsI family protein